MTMPGMEVVLHTLTISGGREAMLLRVRIVAGVEAAREMAKYLP